MSVQAWLVILHIAAAVLPSIGIGHAIYRKRRPVAKLAEYKRVTQQYEADTAAAESRGDADEVQRLHDAYIDRINVRDRKNMGLAHYAMTTITAQQILDKEAYQDLLKDAIWVLAGIAIGGVADVWGLFV